MVLIGYARVSTDDQDTAAQQDALKAHGCTLIYEDKASGGARDRPKLAQAMARVTSETIMIPASCNRFTSEALALLSRRSM